MNDHSTSVIVAQLRLLRQIRIIWNCVGLAKEQEVSGISYQRSVIRDPCKLSRFAVILVIILGFVPWVWWR